jgi:multidrug efflux pump subunit AcrA (membrane-fusion protein)
VQIPAEFQAQAASLRASLGFCGFTPTLGGGANAAQTQPKVGMTASVTLCLDARAGVLSVPTRAIKTETASGQITRYVEVQDEQGNKVKKTVTLGLQGDSSTEITGGELKEGDKVITGTSSTNRTNTQQNNPLSGGGGPQQIRIGG